MWYIIYCDEDNSHSLIHHKFVMNNAKVKCGDFVRYFYKNKPFNGTITDMNEDYDVLETALKDLGSVPVRVSTKGEIPPCLIDTTQDLPKSRRSSNPPQRFGQPATAADKKKSSNNNDQSRLKSEAARSQRILDMNKKEAAQRANKNLLPKLGQTKKKNSGKDDDEWIPEATSPPGKGRKHKGNSSSSDDDERSLNSFLNERKKQRVELVKGIRKIGDGDPEQQISVEENDNKSPTKEELKQELMEMKIKMQLYFDDKEGGDKKTGSGPQSPEKICTDNGQYRAIEEENEEGEKSGEDGKNDIDDKVLDTSARSNTSDNSLGEDDSNIDHEYELLKHQLYGKDSASMVLLVDGIYCKSSVVSKALSNSTAVSHVARRLIEGVFKPEAIKKCTLSGQPYKVVPGMASEDVEGLNPKAVRAIITYAKGTGKKRSWSKMRTADIKSSMTQRMGELKRKMKKKET